MPKLAYLNAVQNEAWDGFVVKHKHGQCYHTTSWGELVEKSFKHITFLKLALLANDGREIEAGIPVYLVKSWLLGNRLVSVPFGTLCDPLIENEIQLNILIDELHTLKNKYNCKRLELKLFKDKQIENSSKFSVNTTHKHQYLYLDDTFDKIESKFKRTVRQAIKKAKESNLTVIKSDKVDDLKQFYRLYLITRKRNNVPAQPFRYFKNLLFDLGEHSKTLYVKKENEIIGSGIVLSFKNRVSLEFLASDTNYLSMRPNHLLAFEAIKQAKEEGYHTFDFGRTLPDDTGLLRFKKYWGTKIIDLKQAVDADSDSNTYDKDKINFKLVSYICGIAPMPIYKLLNLFFYKHLG
jgi:hypothetical protein